MSALKESWGYSAHLACFVKEDTELERKGASQELLKLQVVSQISQDAALELS